MTKNNCPFNSFEAFSSLFLCMFVSGYIDVTFEKLQDKYFISLDCKDLVIEKVTNLKSVLKICTIKITS